MTATLEKKAFLYLLLGLNTIYSSAGGQKGMRRGAVTCSSSGLFLGKPQNETITGREDWGQRKKLTSTIHWQT